MLAVPTSPPLDLAAVCAARDRIAPFVNRTPILTSRTFDERTGARLFFKAENFQRIGAFKARGAHNAVFSLTDAQANAGVVTHSSGNHAAALSLAARNRKIPAYIIMPENAPAPKVASVRRLGGKITFCAPTLAAREAAAAQLQRDTGATLIHPYDDANVIAGQGTAALELLGVYSDLDAIIVPVGGGGLLSGTALAAKGLNPKIKIYGAEPSGADDAARSFHSGTRLPMPNPQTIADGLRTALGEIPFAIIRSQVDDIVTVSEAEIIDAMKFVWSVLKVVIEPSAAVPVAALLNASLPLTGKRVGIILSGGNVDLDHLPWLPPRA
jgi:threonine dehydratase